MAELLVFLLLALKTIAILAGIVFVLLLCVGLFSLNAHVTAAEYTAKTVLNKDRKKSEPTGDPAPDGLDGQEYEELRGLYGMWHNGKWLIIWTFRLLCWLIWCIPPLFCFLPKPKKIFAEYQPPKDGEEEDPDTIPVDKNSWFFKIYRGFKGYEKGYLGASTAYLLTRKSKISKGLGAAAAASAAVRKKRELDRKAEEAEQQAEQEKLDQLQKMEDDLRIRAYPEEAPPVIGEGEGE